MFRKRDNEGLSVLQQIAMARGGDTVQAEPTTAPEAEPIKTLEAPLPKQHTPQARQLKGRALAEFVSKMGRRKRRERQRQRERELLERKEQERRGEVDRGEQRAGGNSAGGGSGKDEEEAKRQLDFGKAGEEVGGAAGQGTVQEERRNGQKRKKDEKREEEANNPINSLVDGPGRFTGGAGGRRPYCQSKSKEEVRRSEPPPTTTANP